MNMFIATIVSFAGFILILSHLPPRWMRRLCGYKAITDVLLHGTIIWMFIGTSTMGLLQAEAAGICFSLFLRAYRYFAGYEILRSGKWVRFAGIGTREGESQK
jgi:presenilin-like A22 family membrane protease